MRNGFILSLVAGIGFAAELSAQPAAPVLVSPTGITNVRVPTFTWNAVTGATDYYLWLAGSSGALFTQWYTGASVCSASTCSLNPNLTLAEGPYTWWVQAKSGTLVGPWSAAMGFRVSSFSQPPSATTLVSPSGTSALANPVFTWQAIATATDYYLWIDSPSGNVFKQWYSAAPCQGAVCSVTLGLALAHVQYKWWVQTRNGAGDGHWSAPMQFTHVAPAPPPPPTPTSPNGVIANAQPFYSWMEVASATDYYLWIEGPSGVLLQQWYTAASVCGTSICSVRPNLALVTGEHRWWIQARNGSATGLWSGALFFTVTIPNPAPATAPALVSPWGTITSTLPTYSWNPVGLATDYNLWVNGPSGNLIQQWYPAGSVCTGTICTVTPNVLLAGGNHSWWVQARNGSAIGPWSHAFFFTVTTTLQPPAPPTLVSPSGSVSAVAVSYTWNAVTTATDYYLWVDGPSGNVIKQWYTGSSLCAGASCSVTPNVNLATGTHTWWVQASNGAGPGLWSAPKQFTFSSTPAAPTLVSPSGTISDVTPTYRWNAVGTATDYYLWIEGPSGHVLNQWYTAAAVCAASTCSTTPTVALVSGGHTWWVQARNASGIGPWSSAQPFQVEAAAPSPVYVDRTLSASCPGNYSVASRNCSGSDGNAYRTVAAGVANLTAGKTLYIRAGTYVENATTVPTLGTFSSMTTITAYPGETVVWQNNDIYFDTLSLGGNANNITVRGIDFKGKRYIGSNDRQWIQWQGNVWRTTDSTKPLSEVIEVKSGCNASTLQCTKAVRSYLGQEKTSPADLLSTGTDGDFYQGYPSDFVLYLYSASGNPGQRTNIWETGWGITIGNTSSGTGYVVVEECSFDGQGHAHLKGGYRWKVSKNTFTQVGTDWNDHHIYSWSNLSPGNEAVYEHNYFETDSGMGAAIHIYGTGAQVANQPPDYHIFRYNLVRGGGFWGVLLDGSHSQVVNNSFSLEGNGDRAVNLQNYDASFNTISNNIFSRPANTSIIFEGAPGNQPTSNVVEFNLTDAGNVSVGTCSGCTFNNNRLGTSPGWVVATPSDWSHFRLAAGSAAIDQGLSLGAGIRIGLDPSDTVWPPSTADQALHGSAWEVGAFVYR